jgi:hypothetical protein
VGIEQLLTLAGKVTVAGLLCVIAYGFAKGWIVAAWVYHREREMTDKTMGLLADADERVKAAAEQVRRAKDVAVKAMQAAAEQVRRAKDVAVKAMQKARECEDRARALEAELARLRGPGGGRQ